MAATPRSIYEPHLVLVDAANLYAKARYKLRDLSRSDGVPSGGLFGAIRGIQSLKRVFGGDMIVCFEGGRNERKIEHSFYKANRPADRDTFQVDHMEELWHWCGMSATHAARAPGHEADDVIAYYVELAPHQDTRVLIVSSDHDFKRLLWPGSHGRSEVRLCRDSVKGTLYSYQDFCDDEGYGPERYHLVQSITGDSSDNVPGVPGIGPKKAKKILEDAGWDLFVACQHPRLVDHFDVIMRNHTLLAFHRDLHVFHNGYQPDPFEDELDRFYAKWEFGSMRR